MGKLIRELIRIWHLLERSLLIASFVTLTAIAFLQIVLRNLATGGIYWADGMLRYLVLWIGMLGAMIATQERNHISIDLLEYVARGRAKMVLRSFIHGFSMLVCTVVTRVSVTFIIDEKASGTLAFGTVPSWIAESIIPFAFAVMTIRFLLYFADDLHGVIVGEIEDRPPLDTV